MLRGHLKSALQPVKDLFETSSLTSLLLIYTVKILESYGYFSLSLLYTLYLSSEWGVSDVAAGLSYGIWGSAITLWGVLLGGIIDSLGVRRCLLLSFAVSAVSRFMLATTSNLGLVYFLLYGPIPAAGALGVPVMTIGVKRYTAPSSRGFAFSLFYSVMNLAALMCGGVIDTFLSSHLHGFRIASRPCTDLLNNGYRLLIMSGAISSLLGAALSWRLADEHVPSTPSELGPPEVPPPVQGTATAVPGQEQGSRLPAPLQRLRGVPASLAASWQAFRATLGCVEFRKFIAVSLLTINVKQIFRHLDATLPKFQIRAFCDRLGQRRVMQLVGRAYSLNPLIIVLLVPVVGAATSRFAPFDMIHYGSYFSALSPWYMVLSQAPWTTYAFVLQLSLGEAVWSPRWYDYSMSVAPFGKEGLYTALAAAPMFLAKLPTGALSGALLQEYCPGGGRQECDAPEDDDPSAAPLCRVEAAAGLQGSAAPALGGSLSAAAVAEGCDGRTMWGIIMGISVVTPVGLLLLQRWLRPRGHKSEDSYDEVASTPSEGDAFELACLDPEPWGGDQGAALRNGHSPGGTTTHYRDGRRQAE